MLARAWVHSNLAWAVAALVVGGCGARSGLLLPDGDAAAPGATSHVSVPPPGVDASAPPPMSLDGGTEDADDDVCPSPPPDEKVLHVAVGGGRSCAILSGGVVKCWGDVAGGCLGLGDSLARGDAPGQMGANLPTVDLGTAKTAVEVSLGFEHTCAVLNDGSIKCWGGNFYGPLGLGDTNDRGNQPGQMGDALPAVDLGTGRTAVAVSAGDDLSCALLDEGSVKCWGNNYAGALGQGDTVDRGGLPGQMGDALPPVNLGTGRTAIALSAGSAHDDNFVHACALLDDGSVKCWGSNTFGELGQGDTVNRGDAPGQMGDALPPVNLGTGKTAVAVSAGYGFTCALLNDGSVKCWGEAGLLGLGDENNRGDAPGEMGDALPAVDLGTGATAIALRSGYAYTCALLAGGSLKCWGENYFGQLGLGDTLSRGDARGQMGDNLPAVDLGACKTVSEVGLGTGASAGGVHTCALLGNATLKCWGADGELGLGDLEARGGGPGTMGNALPTVKLFSSAW